MAAAAPTQQGSAPPHLSVVETTLVAPSLPSPPPVAPAPPETSLPLTFFDVFWLSSPPVERVFFYRVAPDADIAAILSNLKKSLSQAVRAYYPLAGRLRLITGTTNRYELYYQPGDGVSFTVAEYYGADVDELATDEPKDIAKIVPLLPRLPEGGAVLALQATVLKHGIAVGFAVHHAACDGASSTRFLHAWSAACTGTMAPPPPVLDRSLMPDPGLYDNFLKDMSSIGEMLDTVETYHGTQLATFKLSKEDLQRVKEVVAGEAARRGAKPPRCSSLVATFGFMWSCYQRAKDTPSNGERTYIGFPVDHRSRRKPPVPDEYLGNCVGVTVHGTPKDQLAAAGAGGLFTACTAVAAAIEEAVGSIESGGMNMSTGNVEEAFMAGMLAVAGSPRFNVYKVDLGFGRPLKVEIVSVARTGGAMAVAESRSSAGGMEVGISFQADGMERFQGCFAESIALLRHDQTGQTGR